MMILLFKWKAKKACIGKPIVRERREREKKKGKRRFCNQCCIVDVKEKSTEQHSLQTHREFYSNERDLREHLQRRAQQAIVGEKSGSEKIVL